MYIFVFFFGGIGIIETEVGFSIVIFTEAKVQAD
jgi:hypothetical protein